MARRAQEMASVVAAAAEAVFLHVSSEGRTPQRDAVPIEEGLEIRVECGRVTGPGRPVALPMRTPGDDIGLAVGFLFCEGVIESVDDIDGIRHTGKPLRDDGTSNVIKVQLRDGHRVDLSRLERDHSLASNGVTRITSLEAAQAKLRAPLGDGPILTASLIHSLPRRLRRHHNVYDAGGMHVAGLFDGDGRLLRVREDVGRHNAVDKIIGQEVLGATLPRPSSILFVDGRASFDLVQKALVAGVPVLATVGAPSSLAVELAAACGMTLLGFVREGRFNVYCGSARVGEL
jgi:FdhD protein